VIGVAEGAGEAVTWAAVAMTGAVLSVGAETPLTAV